MIAAINDYNLQWTAAAVMLAAFFCFALSKEVGRVAAGTVFYILCSGIWTWLSSANRYATVNPYDQQAIRFFSADAVCKLLMVCAVPFLVRNKDRFWRIGELAVLVFWLVNLIVMMYQAAWVSPMCLSENVCGSLVGNPSMNAGLMVAMTPIVFMYVGWACLIPMVFVLLFSKASVPLGMAAAGLVLWGGLVAGRVRYAIAGLLAGLGALACGWMVLGSELSNSGDRVLMWKFFLEKWDIPLVQVFGTGYGTFGVFSMNLQKAFSMRANGWWIWLHNDWLQEMMEIGVVGLILLVSTYLVAASRLFFTGRREYLVSFLLYGLMMSMNYPLHLAPTAIFGAWLALCALQSDAPNPY